MILLSYNIRYGSGADGRHEPPRKAWMIDNSLPKNKLYQN